MRNRVVTVLMVMHLCVTVMVGRQSLSDDYLETVWNTVNGLPQSSVNAIVQTRDGYLWLGTYAGLVRFDGIRFKIFNTGNTPGLKSNRILSLFEAHDGTLWIGTDSRDLMSLKDGVGKTFAVPTGPLSNNISSINEDAQGAIWVGTARGLVRLQNGVFSTYGQKDGAPEDTVWAIEKGQQGKLWLSMDGALVRLQNGVLSWFRQPNPPISKFKIPISCPLEGSCWIASKNGLARFVDGRYLDYTDPLIPRHPKMRAMLEDRSGNIWLAYWEPNCLIRFRDGSFSRLELKSVRAPVRAILQDRDGNLWLGTEGGGLLRLAHRRLQTYTYKEEDGLLRNVIQVITGDRAGDMYIGTRGQLLRWQNGKVSNLTPKISPLQANLSALCIGRDGSLWVGGDEGIVRLDKSRRALYLSTADGLTDSKVNSIFEDRDGNIWIGTIVGLNRFRNGKFRAWRQSDGLVYNDVRCIMQARDGALWIGTVGGLSRFKDGKFANYTTANGLPSNQVRDTLEASNGALWIATYGGGLSYFHDGRFIPITSEQGLFDDFISRILPDRRGNFWFLSNHGIFRVKRSDLDAYVAGRAHSIMSVSYGVADGMISSEGNGGAQPAGWIAADGRLWFPTLKGVAIIDPNEPEPPPPLIAIEEVLIDGKLAPSDKPIELKPDNQELEIHYTALSFTRPELVKFKYRLEGLNQTWINAGTRRSVDYSHLPPGDYSFVVTADNGSGIWNKQGKSLALIVRPAFWQTKYFIVLCLAILAALIVWLYRWRISQLHKKQRLQEAFSRQLIESQESERKRIAAELHDSLGQNLLIIKNRAALGSLTSQDLASAKGQLDSISASATQAIDEVRTIAYNLRPYHLDRLGLSASLEEMIEKVAASSGIQFFGDVTAAQGALPKTEEINLYRVIQECVSNIVKHSGATEAKVNITCQDHHLHVRIEDNGRGIANPTNRRRKGFGLIGIAERVRMLGGTYSLNSLDGAGTAADILIPLSDGRRG